MNKFSKLTLILSVVFFGYPVIISSNEYNTFSASESTANLSMLAIKMRGVCAKHNTEEYINHCNGSTIPGEMDPYDVPHPRVPIKSYIKVKKQNQLIMAELIHRAVYDNKVPIHQPIFGFDLLSTVLAIYSKVCPVVPATFLQTVYHLFAFVHWKTAHNRKEFIPKRDQKWIAMRIQNCTLEAKLPTLFTDTCKESLFSVHNCSTFICTDRDNEFRLMRTDPLVDVVFKSMEIVQSICFPYFTESYRMFHFFHLAIMDTFTDDIKTRWVTQLEEHSYWRRLLGPSFEYHLSNLERCSVAIISNAKFPYRIHRSSLPARIRLSGAARKL